MKEYKIKLEEKRRKDREENGGMDPEEEKISEAEEIKRKFMLLMKTKGVTTYTKW